MSERYSILRPLNMDEIESITIEMLNFFAPMNSSEKRKELGINDGSGSIIPLSVNDFKKYMEEVRNVKDIGKYNHHILTLVKTLVQANFLSYAGDDKGYTMGGEKCYYFTKELTNLQRNNLLWLGECLGLEYIQHKTSKFVVPITGIDANGEIGIGTGTLINDKTILTCAHVLNDMEVDKHIKISDKEIEVEGIKSHSKVDVGIVKLSESVDLGFQMIFGDVYLLADILTMGYPPVPMTRDAYLISQKGEINSLVESYDGTRNFIYSSITRPGNSGGPIFSRQGHIVGISARHLERETDKDSNVVPFFEGITSSEIVKVIKELDSDINVLYEDYK